MHENYDTHTYYRGRPELTPDWVLFFYSHADVLSVDVDETSDGELVDVTVFYVDSTEPFPLSSLRSDSAVAVELWRLLGV